VVVHFTAGLLPARWVALAVLGSIAVNRWLPHFLRTRRGLSTRWVGILVSAGIVPAAGSAVVLFLNFGWLPALAVIILFVGYILLIRPLTRPDGPS
jgi:hypothetical protein